MWLTRIQLLSREECQTISDLILENEEMVKSLGPDIYTGTAENSLTGRYYLFNYLNIPEINKILKPKLQKHFKGYIQCWANTIRKGEYIKSHSHSNNPRDDYLCANIFLSGNTKPGTKYYLDKPETVENNMGEMIVFHCHLVHEVQTYQDDEVRISMGMDILRDVADPDNLDRYHII